MKQKQLLDMKKQAEKYAKSITKNETYQKFLINTFIKGWKQSGKYNINDFTLQELERYNELKKLLE